MNLYREFNVVNRYINKNIYSYFYEKKNMTSG